MSAAEIAELVREFNALPRRPLVPSGHCPNKWVFGLHLVPLPPPGSLLSFVNPGSRYVHCEGPLPIDYRPLKPKELYERAHQIAVLLLKAFVSGMGAPGVPRMAPWEWSCEDPTLGAAVGNVLRSLGVRGELCVVGGATMEEKQVAAETFQGLLKMIMQAAMRSGGLQPQPQVHSQVHRPMSTAYVRPRCLSENTRTDSCMSSIRHAGL